MLEELTMTCFRKVEQETMTFTEGLNVIRGPNEASKTTRLEACAFAMFGSKALRNSLAEVVTWGRKEQELKVSLKACFNGVRYVVTRSKAGAEVFKDRDLKPFVTGQNEVSSFFADLLGADVNVAHHLMLSGQGGLRGVLDQGPKATSNLIETLSDLDLIDRIIEAATEKLSLGSSAVQEDRLKMAERNLAEFVMPDEPAPIDVEKMAQDLAQNEALLTAAKLVTEEAGVRFTVEQEKRDRRAQLERDRNVVLAQAETTALDLAAEKAKAEAVIVDPAGYRLDLERALSWEEEAKAWKAFNALPTVGMTFSTATFEALSARLNAELKDIQTRITESTQRIAVLTPQISDTHVCNGCGQDTSHLAKVALAQAQLKDELTACQLRLATAQALLPEAQENVDEANTLLCDHKLQSKLLPALGSFVTMVETVPMHITWNGKPFDASAAPDADTPRRALAEIEAAIAARDKAKAKVEALVDVIAKLTKTSAEIDEQVKGLGLVSDETFTDFEGAYTRALQGQTTLESIVSLFKFEMDAAVMAYEKAKTDFTASRAGKEVLEGTVKVLLEDIETIQFNNQLVKKVRAARPIIANKLWNLVLTTVSTLFSQMRGEQSVVSKGKDGFTVNGRPVESLSGSTLDILGLAIRCALIKTFVPNCPFLVLDEPSAACDADRSASLIGFVAAAGFKQIILVTHEDTSESLATNLVQL